MPLVGWTTDCKFFSERLTPPGGMCEEGCQRLTEKFFGRFDPPPPIYTCQGRRAANTGGTTGGRGGTENPKVTVQARQQRRSRYRTGHTSRWEHRAWSVTATMPRRRSVLGGAAVGDENRRRRRKGDYQSDDVEAVQAQPADRLRETAKKNTVR